VRATPRTVAETVAAIKRDILADIEAGAVPATVATFSELHDYCDANTYGGMCDDLYESMGAAGPEAQNDAWMRHCDEAITIVDAWLRAGRPSPPQHRAEWGHFGWSCSCGAGREWALAPVSRARSAADRHLRSVARGPR
jgi:hypothetical protein